MQTPRSRLSNISCLLSSLGLALGLNLAILVAIEVVEVPYDSTLWPAVSALGLVPYCIVAMVVAFVSLLKNRDAISLLALVLGIVAVGVAILTTLLVLAMLAVNNPV